MVGQTLIFHHPKVFYKETGMKVTIIDYGAGNIASVQYALKRIGIEAQLSFDFEEILKSDKVIFPGVGQAKSAMKKLRDRNLHVLIPSLIQPVLGICLGMQLMCAHSEEDDTDCLGIFPENVQKFIPQKQEDRVPHMGWSPLFDISTIDSSRNIIPNENKPYVYFVHSYYVPVNSATTATSNFINPFSASIQKDNFYGVQFHPEKSAEYGQQILANFIKNNLNH